MEEKSGTTQAEEGKSSDAIESSQLGLGDLCRGECSQINHNSICMPVCFLLREQAKSQVALMDLQKRINQIEGVQDDVVTAISEVRDCISSGLDVEAHTLSRSCASNTSPCFKIASANMSTSSLLKSKLTSPKLAHLSLCDPHGKMMYQNLEKSCMESELRAQDLDPKIMGNIRTKDSAPESDKQDSGLDSDCREQGQESNPPTGEAQGLYNVNENSSDELLDLLDEIGEKSEMLRQHISGLEESANPSPVLSSEVSGLQLERLVLHNLLSDIKEERDGLKSKIEDLESTTGEIAAEKKDLEKRFISALVKKHKLETKIQGMTPFRLKKESSSSSSPELKDCGDIPFANIAKKLVYKVDSEAVSSVLKETNTIDLQKQVLTYMMENEVLRIKLDQVGQLASSKELEKQCTEKVFREEVRQLMYENEQLRMAYEEQKLEADTLLSRVRMLERVLHSMTVENRELNLQLGESYLQNRLQTNKRSPVRHFSSSGSSGGSLSRRLRLPSQHADQPEISVRCAKSRILPNTSSFIDVTVEDQEDVSDRELAMTLEPFAISQQRSSTPVHGQKRVKPAFSDLPGASSFGLAANSTASALYANERKLNKPLTFNSMKTLTSSSNICLTGRDSHKPRISPKSNTCDRGTRPRQTVDSPAVRPLESIQERNPDPKKFPFYALLEKLKNSPDYKSSSQLPRPETQDGYESSDPKRSSMPKGENSSSSVPPTSRKNGSNTSEKTQEEDSNQTKDKRAGPKNIHKRIQDILDRITAESDAASAVQ